MNKKNGSGSGMFMLEMIMAVFFFLLCSGICVMAFVKADRMSHLAQDTNQAVMIAESMAETWKVGGKELLEEQTGDISSKSEETEKDGDSRGSVCTVYLDQKGEQAGAESDVFFMGILSQKEKNGLETAEITVIRQRDQKQLFTMTTARYVPEQAE